MQVLWHTVRERGRLSLKPPAVLMCPRSRGQMNRGDYLYHWLQEKRCLLNQAAKQKKQSNSPISSLCVQVSHSAGMAMSMVYWVRRQMDSDDKSATRCPSRCMLRHFPSVLFLHLWDATPNLKHIKWLPIITAGETNNSSDVNDEEQKIFVSESVHSGKVVPPAAPTDHPGSVLLSTCSVPTCYHFSPI